MSYESKLWSYINKLSIGSIKITAKTFATINTSFRHESRSGYPSPDALEVNACLEQTDLCRNRVYMDV